MEKHYEIPDWEGGEPKEFVPKDRIPEEVIEISRKASKNAIDASDNIPIKAKPYMVGDINLDEYPTDTSGFGIDRPLTREEMRHFEADSRFKKMTAREQQAAIRTYIKKKMD